MSPPLPGAMAPPATANANAARTTRNPASGTPLGAIGSAEWPGGVDPLIMLERMPGPEDGTDWLALDNLDWAELTAHLSTVDGMASSGAQS
jgi:hypothetical protein